MSRRDVSEDRVVGVEGLAADDAGVCDRAAPRPLSIWSRPCQNAIRAPKVLERRSIANPLDQRLDRTPIPAPAKSAAMAGAITGRTKPTKVKKLQRAQKRKRSDVDVEKLQQAVDELVSSVPPQTTACTVNPF